MCCLRATAPLVACAIALAGCGSSPSADDGPTPTDGATDLARSDSGARPDLDASDSAPADLFAPSDPAVGDHAPADLATPDLAAADLAASDLAVPADLATPGDLTPSRDLAIPSDLSTPADLTAPRDVAGDPCFDGKQDGDETDIDCGGLVCAGCALRKLCNVDGDCLGKLCVNGRCAGVTFTPASFAAGGAPVAVVAAPLDGDNFPDVAVALPAANAVGILFAAQNGATLVAQPPVAAGMGKTPVSVAAGSFKGGRDLAAAVNAAGETALPLFNNGQGGFNVSTSGAWANPVIAVAVADFDKDGKADLAAVPSATPALGIKRYDGIQFNPWVAPLIPNGAVGVANTLLAADVSRDGNPDLVTATSGAIRGFVAFTNQGGGNFAAASCDVGFVPTGIAVGDIDASGAPDVIVAGGTLFAIGFNNGNGLFPIKAVKDYALAGLTAVAAADLDADGAVDLALTSTAVDGVVILLGQNDGTFLKTPVVPTGKGPIHLVSADVNRDGKPDLVVANQTAATVTLLLNTTP
jgi:FG-GAP-like repeat